MAKQSPSEQLDKVISALLGRPDAPLPRDGASRPFDASFGPVIEVIRDLKNLPRADFKARLKADLEKQGSQVDGESSLGDRRASMASTAKAAPEFRTTATPRLSIRGAAAAIEFYKKAFGATEGMRLMQPDGRVGHAEINIGGARIMLADEFPEIGFVGPEALGGSPIRIHLDVEDVDAFAQRAISAGATVVRPVADQLYGDRSGHIRDPFGYTWVISTRKEELSLEEMQRRSAEFMNRQPKPAEFMREGFHTVTPYMVASDGPALLDFAKQVFGAEETFRGIGSAGGVHGEVRIGDSMLMMGGGIPGREFRSENKTHALHVYVEDTDAVYQKALQAGATSIGEPQDHDYGERGASVKDAFGNNWYIATHKGESYIPKGLHNVNVYLHPLRAEPVINFMKRAFGAEEIAKHASPDGVVHHAEVRVGSSVVEMGEAHGPYQPMPAMFFLYVNDADAVHAQAVAAGATSLHAPADQPYGDRVGAVTDPFGNQWWIATRTAALSPTEMPRRNEQASKQQSAAAQRGSHERDVQLFPHLTFDGQCEAAFKFYEQCLHGGIIFMMTYENTPTDLKPPADWRKKISHATFAASGLRFSGSDALPGQYQKPQGFALQFNLSDPVEAERIFKSLAENGTVQIPLQETFWALLFGTLVDQFGIPWLINCEKPA
jgi:PhnB protein